MLQRRAPWALSFLILALCFHYQGFTQVTSVSNIPLDALEETGWGCKVGMASPTSQRKDVVTFDVSRFASVHVYLAFSLDYLTLIPSDSSHEITGLMCELCILILTKTPRTI